MAHRRNTIKMAVRLMLINVAGPKKKKKKYTKPYSETAVLISGAKSVATPLPFSVFLEEMSFIF